MHEVTHMLLCWILQLTFNLLNVYRKLRTNFKFARFQISRFPKDFYRFPMQPTRFLDCFGPLGGIGVCGIYSFQVFGGKKVWRMNRSTKWLVTVTTILDGFSLANCRRFAKLSTRQLSRYMVTISIEWSVDACKFNDLKQ